MIIEQRVQVEILGAYRPYSYGWEFNPLDGGKPLQVGDKVELPPNQVQEEGSSGTVCALDTDYKGELKKIVRLIRSADPYRDALDRTGLAEIPDEYGEGPQVVEKPHGGEDVWGGFGQGDYA